MSSHWPSKRRRIVWKLKSASNQGMFDISSIASKANVNSTDNHARKGIQHHLHRKNLHIHRVLAFLQTPDYIQLTKLSVRSRLGKDRKHDDKLRPAAKGRTGGPYLKEPAPRIAGGVFDSDCCLHLPPIQPLHHMTSLYLPAHPFQNF